MEREERLDAIAIHDFQWRSALQVAQTLCSALSPVDALGEAIKMNTLFGFAVNNEQGASGAVTKFCNTEYGYCPAPSEVRKYLQLCLLL